MPESVYGKWCGDHWEGRFDLLKEGDRAVGAWMQPGHSYPTNTDPCDVPECQGPSFLVFTAGEWPWPIESDDNHG